VVATEEFAALARGEAAAQGMAEARIAVVPHVVMRSNLKLFLERLPVDSEP